MENENLATLGTFIDDTLFLLPEDRKKIEEELVGQDVSSAQEEKIIDASFTTSSPLADIEITPAVYVSEPIPLKGDFTKGILILHEESTLSPSVLEMLVNMLRACGHSMSEVGMVSSETMENRSMEEFQAINAHVVLKFGRIKHPVNQLPFPAYEIHTEDATEFLFADALSSISEDKVLKRKLWNAVQNLFNLGTGN
jgi:hypothetical protein